MGKREVIYNAGHDFTASFMKSRVKRRGGHDAHADWKCTLCSNATHVSTIIDGQSGLVMVMGALVRAYAGLAPEDGGCRHIADCAGLISISS